MIDNLERRFFDFDRDAWRQLFDGVFGIFDLRRESVWRQNNGMRFWVESFTFWKECRFNNFWRVENNAIQPVRHIDLEIALVLFVADEFSIGVLRDGER